MPLHLETLRVAGLIEEVLALYDIVADEKGVVLTANVDPGLHLTADRNRMRQVLANLVDNAVKYTPSGGHVVIEAKDRPEEVVLRVQDTGTGIASDELARIWDRLYRGDRSRSERGLDLGLSLVKAVVERTVAL